MQHYQAIVVGAGAAGGLASLLLAEAGLRVLLLDAGNKAGFLRAPFRTSVAWLAPRMADARIASRMPYVLRRLGLGALKALGYVRQPVQSKCFAWPLSPASFVDDRDFPYTLAEGAKFAWFRSHQVGGRMVAPGHGRQYRRLHPSVFAEWPVGAEEIAPWYDEVETRLGSKGVQVEPTSAERASMELLSRHWPDIQLGEAAAPLDSAWRAVLTGNVECTTGAVVRRIEVNANDRVEGVSWTDLHTREERRADAPLVFLCASALESTRILMCSTSKRRPDGIGGSSGALGRNLMDHLTVTADAEGPPLASGPEPMAPGRCVVAPRLVTPFGSTSVQVHRWSDALKSHLSVVTFGEMRPRAENRVTLDPEIRDVVGNPVLRIDCRHSDAERALAAAQAEVVNKIAETLGARITRMTKGVEPPGTAIHECGTARMGSSPNDSVLDPNNECWEARGLYVTDAACFPTQGVQHPTLTIKALTARACAHALNSAGLSLRAGAPSGATPASESAEQE